MDGQKFPRRPVVRRWAGAALVALALLGPACGGDADGAPAAPAEAAASARADTTTTEADDAMMPSTDDTFPDGLRGVRYCEVLLLSEDGGRFSAEVWNTLGLGDCPQEAWEELDAEAIAAERGVLAALLNGPRYWVLDTIVSDIRGGAPTTTFGSLDMFRAATVDLGEGPPDQTPYTERGVARETIFRFKAGSEVYELAAPDGRRYVMQALSQKVDPGMSFDRLPELGADLDLPDGWAYSTRVLDEDLDLVSLDGVATVLQDELQNTYQRVDTPTG